MKEAHLVVWLQDLVEDALKDGEKHGVFDKNPLLPFFLQLCIIIPGYKRTNWVSMHSAWWGRVQTMGIEIM